MHIDKSNAFAFPLLYGEAWAFGTDKNKKITNSGMNLILVGGYQARNNNRVSITTSMGLCSNYIINKNI